MKTKINKTNAARLLDKAKVAYELIPYEVDENDRWAKTSIACSRRSCCTATRRGTSSASSPASMK